MADKKDAASRRDFLFIPVPILKAPNSKSVNAMVSPLCGTRQSKDQSDWLRDARLLMVKTIAKRVMS